jgi:hypothetical protein
MLISEILIENIVERFEDYDDTQFAQLFEAMSQRQPAVHAYFFTEDAELLTQDEREWALYLALVILHSVESIRVPKKLLPVPTEHLEQAEEANWETLEKTIGKTFRDRITIFYDTTKEEDLLSFIEDALTETDETTDNIISKEGREPLFVMLKTVVDVLLKA